MFIYHQTGQVTGNRIKTVLAILEAAVYLHKCYKIRSLFYSTTPVIGHVLSTY